MRINQSLSADEVPIEDKSDEVSVSVTKDSYDSSFITLAVLFSFICLLFLISSILNTLFLIIYLRKPSLRNISNRFIVSLTVCNLSASWILLPVTMADAYLTEKQLGAFESSWICVCTAFNIISDFCISASILATLLIALDRFFAITDPLHYHMLVTKGRSYFLIGLSWGLAFFVGAASGAAKYRNGDWNVCPSEVDGDQEAKVHLGSVIFAIFNFLFVFAIPLMALSWAYSKIYKAAQQNSKRNRRSSVCAPTLDSTDPNKNVSRSSSTRSTSSQLVSTIKRRLSNASLFLYKEEARAAKISAVVIVLFILCWAPFYTLQLVSATLRQGSVPNLASKIALLLALSNAGMSPYIYIFRSKRIQKEVLKFCGIRLRPKRNSVLCQRRLTYQQLPSKFLKIPGANAVLDPHFYGSGGGDPRQDPKRFLCNIFRSVSLSPDGKTRHSFLVVSSSCSSSGVSTATTTVEDSALPRLLDEVQPN